MAVLWDGDARNAVGEPVEVPGVFSQIEWAALAADGTLAMALGAEEFQAVVVNDRGETVQTLSGDGIDAFYPRFSPDGRRAALAASFEGEQELWIYELSTALLSQLPVGFPPYSVDWSDDGTRILATGSRARRGERPGQVWSRPYDASDDPALLLELPGRRVRGVSVSPTGGALALIEDAGPNPAAARYDILVTDGTDDAEPQPFAAGAEDEAGSLLARRNLARVRVGRSGPLAGLRATLPRSGAEDSGLRGWGWPARLVPGRRPPLLPDRSQPHGRGADR